MKRLFFTLLVCIFFSSSLANGRIESSQSIAIMGDSIATGGGIHPAIKFDFKIIWDILLGKTQVHSIEAFSDLLKEFAIDGANPGKPNVLWPASREYKSGLEWVAQNLLHSLANLYLNTEQLSFGYLLGRSLGAAPDDIYIAAYNGARMRDLSRQADRLITATEGKLPRNILVFFTGNDLCAQKISLMTSSADFGSHLEKGLRYLIKNGSPHPQGTNIYVMSYLGVVQLLLNPSILDKKLVAFGENTTCSALRDRGYRPEDVQAAIHDAPPESIYLSNYLPPNPALLCPTIMALPSFAYNEIGPFTGFGQKNRQELIREQIKSRVDTMIADLSTRVRSYQATSSQVVRNLQGLSVTGISLHFVGETSEIELTDNDIAADCFHLSVHGQIKIAKTLQNKLKD